MNESKNSRSGRGGKEKNGYICWEDNAGRPTCSLSLYLMSYPEP
jgi:hypothetical protein